MPIFGALAPAIDEAALGRMQRALAARLPTAGRVDEAPLALAGADVARAGEWVVALTGTLRGADPPTAKSIAERLRGEATKALVSSLAGAFAIAVFHVPTKALTLARDGTGQRALYVAKTPAGLAFASEAKALFARGDLSRAVDRRALVRYLAFSFVPGEATLAAAIGVVPPGTIVTFDERGHETDRVVFYWPREPDDVATLDAAAARPEVAAAHARALRADLEDVVRSSLAATAGDGPLAAFLSGGIDSSLVVALAARLGEKPTCYSLSFGDDLPNELIHSRAVAAHVGAEHRVVTVTPEAMAAALEDTVYTLDDPIGDPLTVPNFLLASKVAVDGFRRAANGEGGDPCFGGPKNVPMLLAERYGQGGEGARGAAYLRSYQKLYDDLPRLLAKGVLDEVTRDEPLYAPVAKVLFDPKAKSFLNKLQAVNLVFKGGGSILVKVEKIYGAHGLTPLSPLFDRAVAERAWAIPPSLKLRAGVEKIVLKDAVRDLLPAAIVDRKKSGMLVPVHPWFQGPLAPLVADAFSIDRVRARGLFEPEFVRDLASYRGATTTRGFYGAKLWLLLTLEIWMRLFVDGEAQNRIVGTPSFRALL